MRSEKESVCICAICSFIKTHRTGVLDFLIELILLMKRRIVVMINRVNFVLKMVFLATWLGNNCNFAEKF